MLERRLLDLKKKPQSGSRLVSDWQGYFWKYIRPVVTAAKRVWGQKSRIGVQLRCLARMWEGEGLPKWHNWTLVDNGGRLTNHSIPC